VTELDEAQARRIAAERLARLLALLACPQCGQPLQHERVTRVGTSIADADLTCGHCGDVGVIRSYRPSFHLDDLGDRWSPAGLAEAAVDLQAEAPGGQWTSLEGGGLLSDRVGACLTGVTTAPAMAIQLEAHPWGGAAFITLGDSEHRVELHSDGRDERRIVVGDGRHDRSPRRWSIVNAVATDPASHGGQVLVTSAAELLPAAEAPPPRFRPVNRGNPYPERLATLLDRLGPDAVAIDVGGGNRCHSDPRLLNFEYLKFAHADFFGDGLHLPIASDSVDFVHSQAVLEHVPDPQRAVDELRRILRPGGRVYAEIAFMQPLHAVPFHFFNVTPHGAALLFREWDVVDSGVFGGLSPTVEWFFGVVGASAKISHEAQRSVLDTLAQLDRQLDVRELEHVASAVFVEAIKPA
jgi:SAM-dependent methyltransferase